jgi:hypothetical protein
VAQPAIALLPARADAGQILFRPALANDGEVAVHASGGALAAEATTESSVAPHGSGRSADYGVWLIWLTVVLASVAALRRGVGWARPRPGARWQTPAIAIS